MRCSPRQTTATSVVLLDRLTSEPRAEWQSKDLIINSGCLNDLTTKYRLVRERERREGTESSDADNMSVNCHLRSAAVSATVQESDVLTNHRTGSLISRGALDWKCNDSLWQYEQKRIAIAKKADRTSYDVRYYAESNRWLDAVAAPVPVCGKVEVTVTFTLK